MRRLLRLALLAGAAAWLARRLRGGGEGAVRATVGYADGSEASPEPGSPVHERLRRAAERAL
jgi:hypothetical protein